MKKYMSLVFFCLCFANLFFFYHIQNEEHFRVSFLGVGQGDAILMRHKNSVILYDGGEYNPRGRDILYWLKKKKVKKVDMMMQNKL